MLHHNNIRDGDFVILGGRLYKLTNYIRSRSGRVSGCPRDSRASEARGERSRYIRRSDGNGMKEEEEEEEEEEEKEEEEKEEEEKEEEEEEEEEEKKKRKKKKKMTYIFMKTIHMHIFSKGAHTQPASHLRGSKHATSSGASNTCMCPIYYSESSDLAQRLVQTFMYPLKMSVLPAEDAFQEFLMLYHRMQLARGSSLSKLRLLLPH
ncbi:hypothetical protein PoB_006078600 [Plakobranchus ocellatus]|uniref:Uncharacterized protein n=1 Tax=Plakobranchus ocellatus TaxID=259542 RepID=A0AAV4CR07_9GAST|nr:hypothetical protein PoB_006078600 [Plakobranchus ocellatus]